MDAKIVLRVSVWIAALVALYVWLPTVIDAILLFCAAGVVPGTGIVLSPGQTLAVLGAVGVGSVLLIFRRNVTRAFRRKAQVFDVAVNTTAPMLPLTRKPAKNQLMAFTSKRPKARVRPVAPKPAVIITIPGSQGLIPKALRAIAAAGLGYGRIVVAWARFYLATAVYVTRLAIVQWIAAALRGVRAVGHTALAASRAVRRTALIGVRKVRRQAIIHGHLVAHFSYVYWQRTRPYLERFDRAIERRVKQNKAYKAIAVSLRETKLVIRRQADIYRNRLFSRD